MQKKSNPSYVIPVNLPSGICVKTEDGHYYINGKFRNRLGSKRVFESWNFPRVIELSEASLVNYTKGKRIGFRDGTFIKQISNGHIYFISRRMRCKVTSPNVLSVMGLKQSDAVLVSDFEVLLHEEGEEIN